MRLWSLHPRYLDQKGLVALWRESLLAQKVLRGETKGYKNHPQLDRFKMQADPAATLGSYLTAVYQESVERGYTFNRAKIITADPAARLTVTAGQLQFEVEHLKRKLAQRDPHRLAEFGDETTVQPHPLFTVIAGEVEAWERV